MSVPPPSLAAILAEWDTPPYDPPSTDISLWLDSIHALSTTYGIPDTQRPQCALKFIKTDHIRNELDKVLEDASSKYGPIHWAPFKIFMAAFDREYRKNQDDLPFYRRYPRTTGAAMGIVGATLLAPVAVVGVLSAVGFTSAGVAAGSIAATVQSIIYGGATGGIFSLLQSAGATMVLPSVGAVFTGAASTATGVALMNDGSDFPATDPDLLSNPNSSPDDQKNDTEYLLTPQALQAILKSWEISPYKPPTTRVTYFLSRIHTRCEEYGVPAKQRAQCAVHYMPDCREDALAAGCANMSWEEFQSFLILYDGAIRSSN